MEKLCNLWEYKVHLQQMHMFIYILLHFVLGFSVYNAWNNVSAIVFFKFHYYVNNFSILISVVKVIKYNCC